MTREALLRMPIRVFQDIKAFSPWMNNWFIILLQAFLYYGMNDNNLY